MRNTQSLPPLSLQDAEDDRQATREWHTLSAYITDGPCREWELRHKDSNERVAKGVTALDFRGNSDVIVGGSAPHKPGSTGRVWTADNRVYYPSVFDMRWVLTTK